MSYAFLTYRAPASHSRAASRSLAQSLVAVALLLASGPAVEAREYVPLEDVLLFTHPVERHVWQTDGTPEGTRPFELLNGPCIVSREVPGLAPGGALFRCSRALWFSDGTPGGTAQLTGPEVGGSNFVWWEEGQRLFFTATALWSSDLTTSGTRPIALPFDPLDDAIATTEALWWLARERTLDDQGHLFRYVVWRTDGTPDGTGPTGIVLGPDGSRTDFSRSPLMPLGDLWIVGMHNRLRQQIWSIDVSTESAVLLVDRENLDPWGQGEHRFVSDGSRVFFELAEPEESKQIWVTDGTVAGTRRLTDLADVSLSETTLLTAEDPVFFAADDGVHGRELWVTDGIDGDTHLFADLCPGGCSSDPVVTRLRAGGPYFIVAGDADGVRKPWWSDGTLPGTRLMTEACAGECRPYHPHFPDRTGADPVAVGDRVFFNALDPVHGEELWVSEAGEPARRLTDFVPRQPFGHDSSRLTGRAGVDDRLVFDAFDHLHGTEPWVSDGTAAGTHLLVDLVPDDNAADPPPPSPGAPQMTLIPQGSFDGQAFVTAWVRTAEGPVAQFVVESRSPGHDWRYAGEDSADRNTEGWRSYVPIPVTPGVPYTFRAKAVASDGRESAYGEPVSYVLPAPSEATTRCVPDAHTLCLGPDGRFRVRAAWRNQHAAAAQTDHGQAGAVAVPGSDRSGHFWFFKPDNVELVVKVLDGTAINGFHWTFYGALTDVEYWITVTDTTEGTSRTYHNPAGRVCGRGDTESIAAEASTPATAAARVADTARSPIPPASRALSFDAAPRTIQAASHPAETCVPDAETLCLLGGRFRVRVAWTDQHNGGSGVGSALPYSERTGFFTFFDPANVELVVKILDGTAINGKIWVFYGALSDVGYTITVDDLDDGHASRQYVNAPGNICGRADTAAF